MNYKIFMVFKSKVITITSASYGHSRKMSLHIDSVQTQSFWWVTNHCTGPWQFSKRRKRMFKETRLLRETSYELRVASNATDNRQAISNQKAIIETIISADESGKMKANLSYSFGLCVIPYWYCSIQLRFEPSFFRCSKYMLNRHVFLSRWYAMSHAWMTRKETSRLCPVCLSGPQTSIAEFTCEHEAEPQTQL